MLYLYLVWKPLNASMAVKHFLLIQPNNQKMPKSRETLQITANIAIYLFIRQYCSVCSRKYCTKLCILRWPPLCENVCNVCEVARYWVSNTCLYVGAIYICFNVVIVVVVSYSSIIGGEVNIILIGLLVFLQCVTSLIMATWQFLLVFSKVKCKMRDK